jgi:hypothetical protein
MKLAAWILLTLLGCAAALPQAREPDIKFRLAQSYEQSGDFETAARLYEELLAKIRRISSSSTRSTGTIFN